MESMTVLRTWLPPACGDCEFWSLQSVMILYDSTHVVKVYLIVCKRRELFAHSLYVKCRRDHLDADFTLLDSVEE